MHKRTRIASLLTAAALIIVTISAVFAAPPTAYTNILTNGDFSSALNNWSASNGSFDVVPGGWAEFTATTGAGGVLSQTVSYSASPGDVYNVVARIGNRSSSPASFVLWLYGPSAANPTSCVFTIPANSPLTTYRMIAKAPGVWSSIIFAPTSYTASVVLLLDDFNVQYWSGSPIAITTCFIPTPTPTPTFTLTPTPTLTPSPGVRSTWFPPTQVNELGTPIAPPPAAFDMSFSAGEVALGVLLAVLVFSVWAMFMIWILSVRKRI